MRMRRRGSATETEITTGDPARIAAWDGLRTGEGPAVVIRAARAGDAVVHAEDLQVA